MKTVRIIGVDPGLARMGYGVIDVQGNHLAVQDFGCLETPPEWAVPDRLKYLHAELQRLIQTHRPDVMAVEELFFYKNVTTAFAVGQARGVAVLAGAQEGIAYAEYTPMQVKLAVTGYGKADKAQIQEMVRVLLRLTERPKPDDTADALAIAITHAHSAWTGTAGQPKLREEAVQGYREAHPEANPDRTEIPRVIRYGRGVKP